MPYQVVVGNVGSVYTGADHDRAVQEFNDYVTMSQAAYGRAANEPVWLVHGEVVLAEYDPQLHRTGVSVAYMHHNQRGEL